MSESSGIGDMPHEMPGASFHDEAVRGHTLKLQSLVVKVKDLRKEKEELSGLAKFTKFLPLLSTKGRELAKAEKALVQHYKQRELLQSKPDDQHMETIHKGMGGRAERSQLSTKEQAEKVRKNVAETHEAAKRIEGQTADLEIIAGVPNLRHNPQQAAMARQKLTASKESMQILDAYIHGHEALAEHSPTSTHSVDEAEIQRLAGVVNTLNDAKNKAKKSITGRLALALGRNEQYGRERSELIALFVKPTTLSSVSQGSAPAAPSPAPAGSPAATEPQALPQTPPTNQASNAPAATTPTPAGSPAAHESSREQMEVTKLAIPPRMKANIEARKKLDALGEDAVATVTEGACKVIQDDALGTMFRTSSDGTRLFTALLDKELGEDFQQSVLNEVSSSGIDGIEFQENALSGDIRKEVAKIVQPFVDKVITLVEERCNQSPALCQCFLSMYEALKNRYLKDYPDQRSQAEDFAAEKLVSIIFLRGINPLIARTSQSPELTDPNMKKAIIGLSSCLQGYANGLDLAGENMENTLDTRPLDEANLTKMRRLGRVISGNETY